MSDPPAPQSTYAGARMVILLGRVPDQSAQERCTYLSQGRRHVDRSLTATIHTDRVLDALDPSWQHRLNNCARENRRGHDWSVQFELRPTLSSGQRGS